MIDHSIKFQTLQFDWLTECKLPLGVKNFLKLVFDRNGYVAGGFGTLVAQCVLGLNPDGLEIAPYKYLHDPSLAENLRSASKGDIDVWFASVKDLQDFNDDDRFQYMLSSNHLFERTKSSCATEYVVEDCVRTQVVHAYLAPMEEQLRGFDIYNGMVGLTSSTITFPEHFQALEAAHTLHVQKWSCEWTVNRFVKWMERKSYTSITPATLEYLQPIVDDALEMRLKMRTDPSFTVAAENLNKLQRMLVVPKSRCAERSLSALAGQLTGARLLELSLYLNDAPTYDWAMREIWKRSRVQLAAHQNNCSL